MNKDNLNYQKYAKFNRDEIIAKEKASLTESRFEHCLRVEDTAIKLAKENGADETVAGLAGLVHDYAKQRPKQEFIDIIRTDDLDPDLLNYGPSVWHGYVGYRIIEDELGIDDVRILDAVKYHTIASPDMDVYAKIVYMADYIEPHRSFSGVDKARKLTEHNLDEGVRYQNYHTTVRLAENGKPIYPEAIVAYNKIVGNHEE